MTGSARFGSACNGNGNDGAKRLCLIAGLILPLRLLPKGKAGRGDACLTSAYMRVGLLHLPSHRILLLLLQSKVDWQQQESP